MTSESFCNLDDINDLRNLYLMKDFLPNESFKAIKTRFPETVATSWSDFLPDSIIIDSYVTHLTEYIKNKIQNPMIDLKIRNDTDYYEYPDFSVLYTYDEILSTFNSFSETDVICMNYRHLPSHKTFYLTQQSYGRPGNVLNKIIFDYVDSIEYLYKDIISNQYIILINDCNTLILTDRKIEELPIH